MVRQARNYMVGAVSGAGLIAAAVVAFVVLVSALVFEDLPVAGLVGGEEPSVSAARPAATGTAVAGATPAPTAPGAGGGAGARKGSATAGGSGGGGAAAQGIESSGQQAPGTGNSGGETGGGSGGRGSGGSTTTTTTSGGSGGGATGTASNAGGSGSGGGDSAGGGTTTSSTSGKVTSTVNETVNQVDQTVTGGALEETGITQTTEEVVNGVAGPESTVGKVVDGTVKTVEGILKPK